MEFLTIFLSSLLALVAPVGLVIDSVIANNLRSRLYKVEQLQVRVDNAPNYQIVQGKVERVRVGGRGLWLTPDIRIGTLEIETDSLNVDIQSLRQGGQKSPRTSLQQPIKTGVRLVLHESDINKALQSPTVVAQLRRLSSRISQESPERYEFLNPRLDFLGDNRIRFQVELQDKNAEPLALLVESGLSIGAGHRLQLTEPVATINGQALSPRIVTGFAEGISRRFDLRTLQEVGITARVLQFKVDTRELEVAAFVQVDASNPNSTPTTGAVRP